MHVSTVWPSKSKKLYHIKAGTLFQITPNDGTTDHNYYLMTQSPIGDGRMVDIVNIKDGHISKVNSSKRGVEYLDATIHIGDNDD